MSDTAAGEFIDNDGVMWRVVEDHAWGVVTYDLWQLERNGFDNYEAVAMLSIPGEIAHRIAEAILSNNSDPPTAPQIGFSVTQSESSSTDTNKQRS